MLRSSKWSVAMLREGLTSGLRVTPDQIIAAGDLPFVLQFPAILVIIETWCLIGRELDLKAPALTMPLNLNATVAERDDARRRPLIFHDFDERQERSARVAPELGGPVTIPILLQLEQVRERLDRSLKPSWELGFGLTSRRTSRLCSYGNANTSDSRTGECHCVGSARSPLRPE